jgi:hypothetical protein
VPHVQAPADEQPSALTESHTVHDAPAAPQVPMDSGVHSPLESQQPLGHDVASQTQLPCEQCRPDPHAPPVPQRQAPSEPQLSLSELLQATQVEPLVPQVPRLRVRQVAPSQHPSAQDAASQTQRPATHAWPAPQDACPPQVHAPAVHPSAVRASHTLQVPPTVPHADIDRVLQVVPLQQPPGHDVASQAQAPETHSCPEPHAEQAAPPVPQVVDDDWWQVVPEQHPSGHMQPLHTPALQTSLFGQAWHAWPAAPQLMLSVPGSQVAPLQHPVGQDWESHTHLPASQRCPSAHAGPDPQPHVPPVQWSLLAGSHELQRHLPCMHVRPGGHPGPPPHEGPTLA